MRLHIFYMYLFKFKVFYNDDIRKMASFSEKCLKLLQTLLRHVKKPCQEYMPYLLMCNVASQINFYKCVGI